MESEDYEHEHEHDDDDEHELNRTTMAINLSRRKVVMGRSIALGHCVCNPTQPCPCDMLKDHNICPCAGERLPGLPGQVALTRHVRKAGCASKIGQADLLRVLKGLPPIADPNVLLGAAAGDDAGVYKIDEHTALVQSVDVFTPCVDDPYLFGQIAAANSLSDLYAMGARPLTALSIIGFPIERLDASIMQAILAGGMAKLEEAGCALLGGHSINDEEIKCGFAVTGLIAPGAAVERGRARVGDALVLTKPLGTGIVSFGAQIGRVGAAALAEAGRVMATLNKDAARLMVEHEAHACTDITGFGLAGHLVEMTRTSGVAAEIDLSALPVLAAAGQCLRAGIFSGAVERNQEYSMAWVRVAEGEEAGGAKAGADLAILYDPQTSGGLLVALAPERALAFVEAMRRLGHEGAAIVGRIVEPDPARGEGGELIVIHPELKNFIGESEDAIVAEEKSEKTSPAGVGSEKGEPACCAAMPSGVEAEDLLESEALFAGFMKEANRPGLIDARAKKLIAIALAVAMRCEPCLRLHLKAAIAMGVTKAEMDEAAWLAIGFAGAPCMMLYKQVCAELCR